jgi:hypothetical protein
MAVGVGYGKNGGTRLTKESTIEGAAGTIQCETERGNYESDNPNSISARLLAPFFNSYPEG